MIDEEGGVSEIIQTDVTNEESCKNAVARTVELWGALHILVNIGEFQTPKIQAEDDHLRTTPSGRRRRHGRRHRHRLECVGPRLPHQRHEHGDDEPARDSRDAEGGARLHRQHVVCQRQ